MLRILDREVGSTGFGLMGLTFLRPNLPSTEQSLQAMRAALEHGCNFWNGGELYGTPQRNSLHLLNEYFTQYPGDASKTVISVKGGLNPGTHQPDGSRENVHRSINECLRVLDGKKFLDIFECARVDPDTPIETTIEAIADFIQLGKLGGISLSEVNANTIRRAYKIHPIACVEVEFSMYCTDILHNGIAQTCGELGIPIVAYSPLGRGFLTGQIRRYEDIPEKDYRRLLPRFQPDVFYENIKLGEAVEEIAKQKGATTAQVALAWVRQHSERDGCPIVIPIPGATTCERIIENAKTIDLTGEEFTTLNSILKQMEIKGERYPEYAMKHTNG